jgi:hypothetical protein
LRRHGQRCRDHDRSRDDDARTHDFPPDRDGPSHAEHARWLYDGHNPRALQDDASTAPLACAAARFLLDLATGKPTKSIGAGSNYFREPSDVGTAPSGAIFVADDHGALSAQPKRVRHDERQ